MPALSRVLPTGARTLHAVALLIGVVRLVGMGSLSACPICVPFPQESVADRLLDADAVVLAREDSDRPFHLVAGKVLKGKPGPVPIDLFLDSATRRTLRAFPDRHVVVVATHADDSTSWSRIGVADAELARLVVRILRSADHWQKTPGARYRFFGPLLAHEDTQISRMAHVEVSRAPYSEIRRLGGVIPPSELRSFLGDIRNFEWQSLAILLLAQSEARADQSYVRDRFRTTLRLGMSRNLAAWTAARIEIDGFAALDEIDSLCLKQNEVSVEQLREMVRACSVHGRIGPGPLRDRIVETYARLFESKPDLMPEMAKDLIDWRQDRWVDALTSYVEANPRAVEARDIMWLRGISTRIEAQRKDDRDCREVVSGR